MPDDSIKYPIGVQSFEELRKGGYVYIDKTSIFPELFRKKYYFMSRPRRFGKSLLLSTLEAFFKGKKELFEGLTIYDLEKEWIEYPVVHIDFATMNECEILNFEKDLRLMIKNIAEEYGVDPEKDGWYPDEYTLGSLFSELIRILAKKTGRNVVVLIDEYDKGILDLLQDEEKLQQATVALRPFFSVLKSQDRYIKFAFVTGVSRFRNTTLFSGFNNPSDISMDARFGTLLGITKEEMLRYLSSGIKELAESYNYPCDKTIELLINKYDGYRFTRAKEYVFNPFSLLSALDSRQLDPYWIMTYSSRILAKFLKKSRFRLEDLTEKWVSFEKLSTPFSVDNPLSLFFQTGYLTIRDFDGDGYYRLGIPNQEVQSSLVNLLIPEFVEGDAGFEIEDIQQTLRRAINNGDVDGMMRTLKGLLASVPYQIIDNKPMEKHLHLCLYMIFMMLGANSECEVSRSAGRVDMVAQTPWRVYVFEFKIDRNPSEALRQISSKGYSLSWEARDRTVVKVGVNFSTELRTISDWSYEII